MSSFCENLRAMNLALYPMMFPSTAWWNLQIPHPWHHSYWTGTLLPFLLGYLFIAGRICINNVTQQCHITRVCLRPLKVWSYYSSFGIISCSQGGFYLSRLIYHSLYILLKLLLLPWCLLPRNLQVHLHVFLLEWILNCFHLYFGTSPVLLFL